MKLPRVNIMKIGPNIKHGRLYKNPKLLYVNHSGEDFIKVINKIPSNAARGCDGISAKLIKRLVKTEIHYMSLEAKGLTKSQKTLNPPY